LTTRTHPVEAHTSNTGNRLNKLRAGVLGANDGIVSTASLVVGVAGSGASTKAILTAGLAGLFAGAMSMAAGEYVSVSSQRDSESAMLEVEKQELAEYPKQELEELTDLWIQKGLSNQLAAQVAAELTEHDALRAHADTELHLDPDNLTNAWHAAWVSAASFVLGSLLPLTTLAVTPERVHIPVTATVVVLALVMTGALSAHIGHSRRAMAILRTVIGGSLAMSITYGVGALFGAAT
jgi:VIT1/CCC1 family predicted Fe2+/Mn2+ transporter